MADWFAAEGVTEVVMEASGSFWKAVWYVLEERAFELKLVNARHVKILLGRKSDVLDAEWLAELLEHGLLRGSFVRRGDQGPEGFDALQEAAGAGANLGVPAGLEDLEDAGIKLDSVASDLLGVSGRAMLRALVDGERGPEVLAELSKGVLRKKIPQLRQALHGRFKEHHGLLIGLCLEHLAYLEGAITKLDGSVDALFAASENEAGVPFVTARDHLDSITGVGKRAA